MGCLGWLASVGAREIDGQGAQHDVQQLAPRAELCLDGAGLAQRSELAAKEVGGVGGRGHASKRAPPSTGWLMLLVNVYAC